MDKQTYILIGRTNPYQAQRNGLFRGRTVIAADWFWMTAEEASKRILAFCCEESDNYSYNDDHTAVQQWISGDLDDGTAKYETLMQLGDLSYDDDGYVWSMVPIDELDINEAKAALAYGLNPDDEETIYAMYEDLRPEPAIED